MLRFDVVGSAFAISVFLLLYYILVGFTVVYFATVFGYTPARANALANWYWIANAISLVVTGVLTDRFRVRKPFMIVGTAISLVGGVLFALAATKPETTYYTFAVYFILSSVGGGMAYVAWMAGFTETVEKHNPAATATGPGHLGLDPAHRRHGRRWRSSRWSCPRRRSWSTRAPPIAAMQDGAPAPSSRSSPRSTPRTPRPSRPARTARRRRPWPA